MMILLSLLTVLIQIDALSVTVQKPLLGTAIMMKSFSAKIKTIKNDKMTRGFVKWLDKEKN